PHGVHGAASRRLRGHRRAATGQRRPDQLHAEPRRRRGRAILHGAAQGRREGELPLAARGRGEDRGGGRRRRPPPRLRRHPRRPAGDRPRPRPGRRRRRTRRPALTLPTLQEPPPMSEPTHRFTLSDLPFAARLTVAAFLISVGVGYFAALVQLHVQQASPGQMLPGDQQLIDTYHGKPGVSVLERLLTADEKLPLSASGSMRSAFTFRAPDWDDFDFDNRVFEKFAESLPKDVKDEDKGEKWEKLPQEEKDRWIAEVRKEVRGEREGEAAAMLEWIRGGLGKGSYDNDKYTLPNSMPLTKKFRAKGEKGTTAVKIRSLIRSRCVICHKEGREAEEAPLVEYKQIVAYSKKGAGEPGGVPLRKLAQSTHVH